MISPGSIPLTDDERAEVAKLLGKHGVEQATLTRRDPGESGPVLVHVGEATYEVAGAKTRKQRAR